MKVWEVRGVRHVGRGGLGRMDTMKSRPVLVAAGSQGRPRTHNLERAIMTFPSQLSSRIEVNQLLSRPRADIRAWCRVFRKPKAVGDVSRRDSVNAGKSNGTEFRNGCQHIFLVEIA